MKKTVKRITAGLLCMLLCLSVLTSCSDAGGESTVDSQPVEAPKVEELHELNIRAPKSIDKMTAVFVNTSNGNSSEIDMTKSKEADSYKVFSVMRMSTCITWCI